MYSFLHESNTDNDPIVSEIVNEFKSDGYAVYWKLTEFLTRNQDNFFIIFFNKDSIYSDISRTLGNSIHKSRVKNIIDRLAELEFISPSLYTEKILFSVEVVQNFYNYTLKNTKRLEVMWRRCLVSIKSVFKVRRSKKEFSMTYEEFLSDILQQVSEKLPLNYNCTITITETSTKKTESTQFATKEKQISPSAILFENSEGSNQEYKQEVNVEDKTETQEEVCKAKEETWDMKMARLTYEHTKRLDPNYTKPNLQNWAKIFNLSPEFKKRDRSEIEKVLLFAHGDKKFWHKVILTPYDLLHSYTRILTEMNSVQRPIKTEYTYDEVMGITQTGDLRDWGRDYEMHRREDGTLYWTDKIQTLREKTGRKILTYNEMVDIVLNKQTQEWEDFEVYDKTVGYWAEKIKEL